MRILFDFPETATLEDIARTAQRLVRERRYDEHYIGWTLNHLLKDENQAMSAAIRYAVIEKLMDQEEEIL